MKILLYVCFFWLIALSACNQGKTTADQATDTTTTHTNGDLTKDWKFGVALWTFHTFNFPDALAKVDSAGLAYIEPNTFHKTGPALNDSLILQLSPAGIEKLKALIAQKGLKAESIYIVGDSTIQSWKKQFDIAKQLGVTFVTTEPPVNMWDSIDSLAGVYGIKVAIHEHWKGVSQYWHPDSVLAAIKDHPNFGACADLGHWPKSGIDPLEAVKKLKGHIIGVHLKDIAAFNDPKLKDVPVGTGVVNFPAIFEELKKQQFKGPIYIERDAEDLPSNLPSVIQTTKYYNEQVNKLQ
jgi:sugar phosphate isomerase/epimerase